MKKFLRNLPFFLGVAGSLGVIAYMVHPTMYITPAGNVLLAEAAFVGIVSFIGLIWGMLD